MMASAVRKTFNDIGTLDPNNDKIPIEKAMSVAEGIAHPFKVSGVLKLMRAQAFHPRLRLLVEWPV